MRKLDKTFLILFIALSVVLLISSVYYYRKTVQEDMSISMVDFRVYYDAATRLAADKDIYNVDGGYFIYKYSPIFVLPVSAIKVSTSEPAGALCVWYVVLFVSAVVSVYLVKEILFNGDTTTGFRFFDIIPALFIFRYLVLINFLSSYPPNDWPVFIKVFDAGLLYVLGPIYIISLFFTRKETRIDKNLLIMVLAVFFVLKAFVLNINRAQVNVVMLVLLLFFVYYLVNRKDALAGVYLGIAAAIKLVPVLFLVYLLLKKKFKALLSSLAAFSLLLFIPSFRWGLRRNIDFLNEWLASLGATVPAEYIQHKNQSLMAAISRFCSANSDVSILNLDGGNLTGVILFLYAVFVFALVYYTVRKSGEGENKEMLYNVSFFFMAMTILSPVGTKTTFVYALLPIAVLIKEAFSRKLKDKIINTGLLIYVGIIYINSSDILGDFSVILHKYSLMTVALLVIFALLIYCKVNHPRVS